MLCHCFVSQTVKRHEMLCVIYIYILYIYDNLYIYTYVYIDVCVYMQIRDDCWIPFRFWGSTVQDERLLKGLSLLFFSLCRSHHPIFVSWPVLMFLCLRKFPIFFTAFAAVTF